MEDGKSMTYEESGPATIEKIERIHDICVCACRMFDIRVILKYVVDQTTCHKRIIFGEKSTYRSGIPIGTLFDLNDFPFHETHIEEYEITRLKHVSFAKSFTTIYRVEYKKATMIDR